MFKQLTVRPFLVSTTKDMRCSHDNRRPFSDTATLTMLLKIKIIKHSYETRTFLDENIKGTNRKIYKLYCLKKLIKTFIFTF